MKVEADESLMVRYQNGEYGAFEEIYQRHSGKVYGYLKKHLPDEADDLLQQTFLKLHHYRRRYDPKYPFLTWLFTITRRLVIDSLRKHHPIIVDSDFLAKVPAEPGSTCEREPGVLVKTLKSLPVEQQELLRLRFEEGLSFDDVAARLGVRPAAARKRVSRIVQALRKKGET